MEANNEIKDFNIAEALKYAPKGLKLYTPLFGEIEFGGIENGMIRITGESLSECFYEDGRYYDYPNTECLLFPSVNHRCWQRWHNTLFLESIGSVCVDTITGNKFILGEDGTYFSDNTGGCYSVIIANDLDNYLLNSRYASPEEAKEFFEELDKNGYEWNGKKVVKKEVVPHKFKVGDIVKFDRPSATVKREILSIDFENERYLTRRTDIGGAIKEFIYFCEQDDYVIVDSHNNNLSLEVKVSILADEIIALKERVKALEIQEIKQCSDKNRLDSLESKMIILDSHNINDRLDALERRVFPIPEICKCPDKAGDNVTLEEMRK